MPADDGPAEWQRITVQVDLERREGEPGDPGRKVDIVEPVEPIEPVALPPVDGDRRRDRTAVAVVLRRSGRRARRS